MLKKILGLVICIMMTSLFSVVSAHESFAWFGLKRNNTEIMINSGDSHYHIRHHNDCCDKHKHKHKCKCHKKGPKHHKHCDCDD